MEQELINDLKNWIKTFLAEPQAELGNLPVCPYAKPTVDNNTIRFKVVYDDRSEEHTSDSSHTVISYAVFCLKKKKNQK